MEFDIDDINTEKVRQEVHEVVKNNRGMSKQWADAMCIPYNTFLAKSNPNRHDTEFNYEQLMMLVALSGAKQILRVLVSEFGLQLVDREEVTDTFLAIHLHTEAETADTVRETSKALGDGEISPEEAERMLKEEYEAQEARKAKIAFLEEIALSGKTIQAS